MNEQRSTRLQWKLFWNFIQTANPPKWIFVTSLLLALIETASGLIVPLFTKNLVDQLAHSGLEAKVVILLATAFLVQTLSSGFSFYFMTYVGEYIVSSIRKRLWNQVLRLPVPFFDEHQSGETMSRVTQDTNILKELITQHVITFVTGTISIIGSIIILLMIDWRMTTIMIIAIPLSLAIIMPLGQKMYKISKSTQDEMADFSSNLGRVLSDIRLVKSYQAEGAEQKRGEKGIMHLFQFGLKEARIQAIITPFMTFVMMLVLVILIGYGGVRVASGALSAGALVAIIIYMFQIVVPFSQMAAFFTAFQKAVGATERIQTILSTETERIGQVLPVVNSFLPLHFQNLTFSYKEEPIIKNMSVTIPAGKTTAFVGPSGGGKTTLFSLLERFYVPDEGKILLGETNIDKYQLDSWRSQIGYVSQECPIMSGTIRENIGYGLERNVSEAEIQQAAELAHADEFIRRLPKGLDTEVGERGIMLSGGQRQRISIARALLRNPQILLLDEATSNLDSASEQFVQKALLSLMEGRTTLIIAHRLSTVVNADQIVVIEHGEITGTGTHQQLLESHALYKELSLQQLQSLNN